MSTASFAHPVTCLRSCKASHCIGRRVVARADPSDTNRGNTVDPPEEFEDAAKWRQIDDQIRSEVMGDEFDDTLPLPFLATVSSFGTALTGYLTWSKLTNNHVVCPMSGCTSILSSPYAQIGPVPLSALGLLGYATVASLCFCSIAIKRQKSPDVLQASMWLTRAQQGILYGVFQAEHALQGRCIITLSAHTLAGLEPSCKLVTQCIILLLTLHLRGLCVCVL